MKLDLGEEVNPYASLGDSLMARLGRRSLRVVLRDRPWGRVGVSLWDSLEDILQQIMQVRNSA